MMPVMQVERLTQHQFEELRRLIARKPTTALKPKMFFIARSGVPTLAHTGWTPTLTCLKRELEEEMHWLGAEDDGSKWPKTTLGALRDTDPGLTTDELKRLRTICVASSPYLSSTLVPVHRVSLVIYECRSLEKRLKTMRLDLLGTTLRTGHDEADEDAMTFVDDVLAPFQADDLDDYLTDLRSVQRYAAHYRDRHIEPTLIHELDANTWPAIDLFIERVEAAFPDRYIWFEPSSRHVTIRSLRSAS
tara:strand:+ start:162 stop:902 length:741 start_codon:yes stop_codon:yes gene_type:complete